MSTGIGNLWKRLFPLTPMPTATVLGLDYSGTTTFLYFVKSGQIVQSMPTFGFNTETVQVPMSPGTTFKMTACEIGPGCDGPTNLRLASMYFTVSEAIVWLVGSNDRERLQESVDLLRDVLALGNGNPSILLILGTKSDKPNSLSADDLRIAFSRVTAGRLSSLFKVSFTKESRQNFRSSGIPEAFDWLNMTLDIAKSLKKRGPVVPQKSDLQAKLWAPNALAQKLESWLIRNENDMPTEEFLEKFKSYNLPAWDHYTHIRIAYLILVKHGRQEGKNIIFNGLEDYIANSQQTKGRSFHITMSYFWIQIVHLGIRNTPPVSGSTTSSLNEFGHFLLSNPHVVDGNLWSNFYSTKVLMSREAKTAMVLPDKKALPNLVARDAITRS